MGSKERELRLVKTVVDWVEREKQHNPSFALVVGRRAFNLEQIKEHVEKGTEDGEMLLDMVVNTGAALFLNHRA